jgi:uncharacterized protein (TIGR02246 family)
MERDLSADDAARLCELEDRAAIAAVVNRYGDGVRLDDAAIVASCFADDAVIVIDHGPPDVLRGRDEILRFYERKRESAAGRAAATFDEFVASTPFISNVTIELDGDAAHCESMCLVIKAGVRDGAGTIVVRGTRNVDDFVRTPAGWKIARRSHPAIWSFEVPGTLLVDPPGPPGRQAGSQSTSAP